MKIAVIPGFSGAIDPSSISTALLVYCHGVVTRIAEPGGWFQVWLVSRYATARHGVMTPSPGWYGVAIEGSLHGLHD